MYMKNNVGIIILVLVVTMLPLNVFADSVNNKNLVDMANAYNEEYLPNEVLEKEGYVFSYEDSHSNISVYGTSAEWLEEKYPDITEQYVIEDQPEL